MTTTEMMERFDSWKLNLGCGKDIRPGWVNVDYDFPEDESIGRQAHTELPPQDRKWFIEADLDKIGLSPNNGTNLLRQPSYSPHYFPASPMNDNTVQEILMCHVLEHLHNPLQLFDELYRVAKPGTTCDIWCPHGASDEADEDPTHVRRIYPFSFGYFSQPYYWRADYGYRGDWQPKTVTLLVDRHRWGNDPDPVPLQQALVRERNVVMEIRATLECIKPARPQHKDLQEPPQIVVQPAVRT